MPARDSGRVGRSRLWLCAPGILTLIMSSHLLRGHGGGIRPSSESLLWTTVATATFGAGYPAVDVPRGQGVGGSHAPGKVALLLLSHHQQ